MKENDSLETVYVQINNKVKLNSNVIRVCDVCKVAGAKSELLEPMRQLVLFAPDFQIHHYVIHTIKIIELIHLHYPQTTIVSIGASEVFVEVLPTKKISKGLEALRLFLVCAISFFGTAFTIMAFHNDISISDLFENLCKSISGQTSFALTLLEVSYSIGLAVGIILFFNHFCLKKFSMDPTPAEVEMRSYEEEILTTLKTVCEKEGNTLDVE